VGDLRPNNGGGWPHDDGLPDFPPEWGTVVIPDDASELDFEATALRRELRRTARRGRLRHRLGLGRDHGPTPVGAPIVIMAVALLTTMISLFVVTWGRADRVVEPPVAAATAQTAVPPTTSNSLADINLTDSTGSSVRLGTLLPAVILLVDGCECTTLVLDLAARVPSGTRVLEVSVYDRAPPKRPNNVRILADHQAVLRHRFSPVNAPNSAAAIVVNKSGGIVATILTARTADDVKPLS
jgi:hypothetical protein